MKSYSEWKNRQLAESFSAQPPYIPTEPSSVSPQVFQPSVNNAQGFGADNRGREEGDAEEAGDHVTLSYGLPVRKRRSFKEYVKLREASNQLNPTQQDVQQPQNGVRPAEMMSQTAAPSTPPTPPGGAVGPGETPTPGTEPANQGQAAPQADQEEDALGTVKGVATKVARTLRANPDLLPYLRQVVRDFELSQGRSGAVRNARDFSRNAGTASVGRQNVRQVAGGNMEPLQQNTNT